MLLASAAIVTTSVLGVALLARLMESESTFGVDGTATDVLRRAAYWEDVAEKDSTPTAKLQHLSMALALLQVARTLRSDHALERIAGFSVERMYRSLDQQIVALRQSVCAVHK